MSGYSLTPRYVKSTLKVGLPQPVAESRSTIMAALARNRLRFSVTTDSALRI